MTLLATFPDGERRAAALAGPETAADLDPGPALADVLPRLLRASSCDRDLTVSSAALRVLDGEVTIDGERLRLRPDAAAQLRFVASRAFGHRVHDGDALRRGLALRGERPLTLRIDGDEIRAVVSDRFVAFDRSDVLGSVARAVEAMGWSRDLRVRFLAHTDRMIVIRAFLRSSRVPVRSRDPFVRGVQIVESATGWAAFSLTPIVFRLACWNASVALQPSLRLAHVGDAHRVRRDWRKELAHALDRARSLLDGWRTSTSFDDANHITALAKSCSLRERLAMERRAQRMIDAAI